MSTRPRTRSTAAAAAPRARSAPPAGARLRLVDEVPRRTPRRRSAAPRTRVRLRRIAAMVILGLLAVSLGSLGLALVGPSNSPVGVRVVEWMRDHGAAGLVSGIERVYYGLNAPATGGPGLRALPTVGAGAAAAFTGIGYRPPPIPPALTPALPGEGVWRGTGPSVRGAPPVLVTTFRPDPLYPRLVAGVAWIDATRAWIQLYPGRYEPPSSDGSASQVPAQLRGSLLAAFNSGFKLEDDHGGFVAFGRVYAPLRPGQATFIRYRNGRADVVDWTGGPRPGPGVEFARQNLPLIVVGGRLNPNLSDGPQWGATLGNAIRVWRSGVGVDARGDILYAAADAQTATSLAQILQRAGAVRAMELDINYEWVTFNFFGAWGAGDPHKLLPGMSRALDRYLSPDDRDFFGVFARRA